MNIIWSLLNSTAPISPPKQLNPSNYSLTTHIHDHSRQTHTHTHTHTLIRSLTMVPSKACSDFATSRVAASMRAWFTCNRRMTVNAWICCCCCCYCCCICSGWSAPHTLNWHERPPFSTRWPGQLWSRRRRTDDHIAALGARNPSPDSRDRVCIHANAVNLAHMNAMDLTSSNGTYECNWPDVNQQHESA